MVFFSVQLAFSQEDIELQTTDSLILKNEVIGKHPILTNRFIFNVGLFTPTKTLKIIVNGSSKNDEIDFNEAFGFNRSESTFASNFVWRFSKSKKWSLAVEYFGVKSNHNINLKKDVEWEDVTYPAGAKVDAGFGIGMYRIFFGRVISSGSQHEFGGGIGVHAMAIKTHIEGEIYLADVIIPQIEKKSVSVVAPVPNIGIWYYYTPSPKWALTARVDWFSISVGVYGGSLWNLAPGVKYQISKNIGVGLNYRYIKTTLNIDKSDWKGEINFLFQGPLFTISGNF